MRQIVEAIAGERLKGGDKLSSHRELSELPRRSSGRRVPSNQTSLPPAPYA